MATVALKDQKRIADLLTYMATIAKLANNIAGRLGWSMTRISGSKLRIWDCDRAKVDPSDYA